MFRIDPHQSRIVLMRVKEKPGETLVIYPKEQHSSQIEPLLVTVNREQAVPMLINNPSKIYKFLKSGTIVTHYEVYTGPVEHSQGQVNLATIENSLEPNTDIVPEEGSRVDRLKQLLKQQK